MKRSLEEFGALSPAEAKLRDEIGLGGGVGITGDWPTAPDTRRPTVQTKDNTIRAEFIRYLMLGGCKGLPKPVPETGVRVVGAWIEGKLDLEGCRCPRDLKLDDCHLDTAPNLQSAELDGVYLEHCQLPGLKADRVHVRGGVFIRESGSTDTIRLPGARIGGDLSFTGSTLRSRDKGFALAADGAHIGGMVSLMAIDSEGTVNLPGVRVSGHLIVRERPDHGGKKPYLRYDCELRPGQDDYHESASSLRADGAIVDGTLFIGPGLRARGLIDLNGATLGNLSDEISCWPKSHGELKLDRCTYRALTSEKVDAASRIPWLDLQDPTRFGQDFWPQPWVHCAKVLREMGHREDAKQVLIEMEKRQRTAHREKMWAKVKEAPWSMMKVRRWLVWDQRDTWDRILGAVVAYGHRPLLAFLYLAAIWIAGATFFDRAYRDDQFKPNNAFVLRSAEWAACQEDYQQPFNEQPAPRNTPETRSQLDCFASQPEAQSYPRFVAGVYSLDTLLPVVAMEMQEFWIPDASAGMGGRLARIYLWLHIAMGWALSLLAVAGFSGLVRSDR